MLAISVESVSKRYRLGAIDRRMLWNEMLSHLGLRKSLANAAQDAAQEFWALKDVSIEIKQGETVGIVGANGAGKSTLLKILSRITAPTSGIVKINGRVGSLLEVGTGFNPEMTGRENVYLNGAIQGMKRPEVDAKFDDIVSFAGVEKFIDTPVKRYSSGMYVRLAFSVAAFLESEIIIVDEVLSVGDQEFQERCIQRLKQIIGEGRTVLFVSHGAGQVKELCKRVVCLKYGKVISDADPLTAMSVYQNSLHHGIAALSANAAVVNPAGRTDASGEIIFPAGALPGDGIAAIEACRIRDDEGDVANAFYPSSSVRFEMDFQVLQSGSILVPSATICNEEGKTVFWTCDTDPSLSSRPTRAGRYSAQFTVPGDFFAPGKMTISFCIDEVGAQASTRARAADCLCFSVADDFSPTSARGPFHGPLEGTVRPRLIWSTKAVR